MSTNFAGEVWRELLLDIIEMIKIETEKSMVNSINIKRDIYFEIFIP
jgi:hypothetical protein